MRGDNIHAPRPKICPGCKEDWFKNYIPGLGDPYGPPNLFIINDTPDGYNKIFLKGWRCSDAFGTGVVFGTVFAHTTGDSDKIIECEPTHDWVFLEKLGKREVINCGNFEYYPYFDD